MGYCSYSISDAELTLYGVPWQGDACVVVNGCLRMAAVPWLEVVDHLGIAKEKKVVGAESLGGGFVDVDMMVVGGAQGGNCFEVDKGVCQNFDSAPSLSLSVN
ncbi:hypothetical protein L2E82_40120 [Cichorium intybus]|uniref:Uncharacterized protein n=1 Tax=Cichorium intybus TaxID=13427 RepID=A0ACB9AJK7_CICIN|nr:hypothetical protein L2E82_40120 [Cichorium intybus]